jgi:hypothetical protein
MRSRTVARRKYKRCRTELEDWAVTLIRVRKAYERSDRARHNPDGKGSRIVIEIDAGGKNTRTWWEWIDEV